MNDKNKVFVIFDKSNEIQNFFKIVSLVSRMKVLIVEDEKEILTDLLGFLEAEGVICSVANTHAQAVDKILMHEYDCILLDLMLPDGDGLDILNKLRSKGDNTGIIIISAKNSLPDKIEGLRIGADDYLEKPFHKAELLARLYSVIRRRQFDSRNILNAGNLEIDLLSRDAFVGKVHIDLTKKEFDLLLFFIANKQRVLSKATIAEHLSGDLADMFDSHDFIYAHVKNLKKKLKEVNATPQIETVYGTGYKWHE